MEKYENRKWSDRLFFDGDLDSILGLEGRSKSIVKGSHDQPAVQNSRNYESLRGGAFGLIMATLAY
jgi:hypothetical protein